MSLPTIVEAWLSEVHDPLQHPPAASPSWHPAASRRLRPRPRRFNNPHIRCKRRLVMPEDASTPPPPPRRSQRVRSRSTTAPDNTLFDDTTPDNTPRPLRTHTVPLFDGPLLPPSAYSDALSQPPPSPTPRRKRSVQSSASGSTTKRSASPVKGMAAVIDAGVKYTDLADMSPDEMQTLLGKEIAELYETFMLFQDLDGVVPAVIRPRLEALQHGRRLPERYFAADQRSTLALELEFLEIERVHRRCRKYDSSGPAHEASWNDSVHSRILDVALHGHAGRVGWENVTRAEISPKTLVPQDQLGTLLESKMVDYAIHLDPTADMTARIKAALATEATAPGLRSVNHTLYEVLRHSPIAVSIETKTPAGNEDRGKAQLAVWGTAHLERLRRLRDCLGRHVRLPTLPLVYVEGLHWWLEFIAVDAATGAFTVFGRHYLGDTKSLVDIYRLVCCIRALAGWADTSFREWWDDLLGGAA